MALIIDVETTGLPKRKYHDYKNTDDFENARMVQFTMMLCDKDLNEIEISDFIIKAGDFTINNSDFHGITNEISKESGHDFSKVAEILKEYLTKIDCIIAHNLSFDANIIKSELFRLDLLDIIEDFNKKKCVCSMLKTKNLVNIKNKYGVKYPSLAELYQYTFNKKIENAHNSKYDVINLHAILKHLYDNKKITI